MELASAENTILHNGKVQFDPALNRFLSLKYPLSCLRCFYQQDHYVSLHNHDFPQLWICLSGEYTHRVEDRIYYCRKGSMVIIPIGVHHRFIIPDGQTVELYRVDILYDLFLDAPAGLYTNAISRLLLPAFHKELGTACPEYVFLSPDSFATADNCCSQLTSINFREQPATQEYICQILEQLFSLPELQLPEQYRQKATRLVQTRLIPMLRVLSFMNSNYSQKISAEKLQQVSFLCHSEFFRIFKLFTGYTYSSYLQQIRVLYARQYIGCTNYSLSYISDICGFTNQAHMVQCFKKYRGMTPSQERVNYQSYLKAHPQLLHANSPFQDEVAAR